MELSALLILIFVTLVLLLVIIQLHGHLKDELNESIREVKEELHSIRNQRKIDVARFETNLQNLNQDIQITNARINYK